MIRPLISYPKLLLKAIELSILAGNEILDVYSKEDFQVNKKEDHSPLTEADTKSHNRIVNGLKSSEIPVLSEESQDISWEERKDWERYWLVDPLDGTKEFINRNDEFTVNIALIERGIPVMGVIYVPVFEILYFALQGAGSFKILKPGNFNSGTSFDELTEAALKVANKHNVTVSVDLNYRKKLWTPEKAQEVMTRLMQYVDVCIGNEEDAEKTLGFKPGKTDVTKGELELTGYKDIFRQMKDKFNFKYIATTLRESYSASDNGWSALIYDGNEFHHSRKYDIRIVDRVGGGDSFAGGLIYSLVTGKDYKDAIEFAVAASALKHTISGDFNLVSVDEIMTLVNGDASGRVQR